MMSIGTKSFHVWAVAAFVTVLAGCTWRVLVAAEHAQAGAWVAEGSPRFLLLS